jgi:hypothetical protein
VANAEIPLVRFYGPTSALTDGTYAYPVGSIIKASKEEIMNTEGLVEQQAQKYLDVHTGL